MIATFKTAGALLAVLACIGSALAQTGTDTPVKCTGKAPVAIGEQYSYTSLCPLPGGKYAIKQTIAGYTAFSIAAGTPFTNTEFVNADGTPLKVGTYNPAAPVKAAEDYSQLVNVTLVPGAVTGDLTALAQVIYTVRSTNKVLKNQTVSPELIAVVQSVLDFSKKPPTGSGTITTFEAAPPPEPTLPPPFTAPSPLVAFLPPPTSTPPPPGTGSPPPAEGSSAQALRMLGAASAVAFVLAALL